LECGADPDRLCGDACIDLSADSDHCGACGNACLPGEICTGGKCLCGSGSIVCGGACVSGTCCNGSSGETCVTGSCCSPHGCQDLQGDAANCGVCGFQCKPNEICDSGICKCKGASGELQTCIGSQECTLAAGCACPGGGTACTGVCKEGEAQCADGTCRDCPAPPPTPEIPRPGDEKGVCCAGGYCSCGTGGHCCPTKGDCFWTYHATTGQVVDEFCCSESGGIVCGDECCRQASCSGGCFKMNPVGGSHRRPGG
jgi:hypothetical protein